MTVQKNEEIREHVRRRYGEFASTQPAGSCCSPAVDSGGCCSSEVAASNIQILYQESEAGNLPSEVTNLSLGCGDPITLAALQPGQTVLDLGSGGGIDCFLAARKVGPTGRVIGVDMTPEMLAKARRNREQLGLENVEFRLGEIENLPISDNSVDVIISNCVINLSPDKPRVFQEAYRVLRPGGRLAVSDMATEGDLPETVKNNLSAWAGCIAGALDIHDYIAAVEAAGFVDVEITPVYLAPEMVDQAIEELGDALRPDEVQNERIYRTVFSAKVEARKPG